MRTAGVPGSPGWRESQRRELWSWVGAAAAGEGPGFGWLDATGTVDDSRGRPLWITARMTYVASLGVQEGLPGASELALHGIAALSNDFADDDSGGWFAALDTSGHPSDTSKANYEHAFVLLASGAAATAEVPGAADLFDAAQRVVLQRFWRDDEGRAVESWDRSFTALELYRGANSNMHSVEAYLATADVTGDDTWRQRALSIAAHLIDVDARAGGWRIPEHFDAQWDVLADYHRDRPDDPFRPYGATPGHGLEWSRLLVTLDAALADPPAWLVEAAVGLFDQAVGDGWRPDGAPGFVYTTDWDGVPVVRERMHWVMTEAVLAADALARRTGDERIAEIATSWWREIDEYFVDHRAGGWHHELTPELTVGTTTWVGKPDVYHAYQACLLPSLPLTPAAVLTLPTSLG